MKIEEKELKKQNKDVQERLRKFSNEPEIKPHHFKPQMTKNNASKRKTPRKGK